jgi:hypothetical protein
MFALALIFGLFAIKPWAASRAAVILTSLIPAGIAAMIYLFMGAFFAGHLLFLSAILALIAGTQFRGVQNLRISKSGSVRIACESLGSGN